MPGAPFPWCGFDLIEFCSAIERRDAASQLDFYAFDAEVRLASGQRPSAIWQRWVGRSQIEGWLHNRCAADLTVEVVYRWLHDDEMMVTEEWRRPDKTTVLTASTAHIADGHIAIQTVVLIEDLRQHVSRPSSS